MPLVDAIAAKGLNPADVGEALAALNPEAGNPPENTCALIDHILERYHETHRRELPELIRLAARVEAVLAAHAHVPAGLADVLRAMAAEMEVHMKKEELILFPMLRRAPDPRVAGPIAQMRREHDDHGTRLAEIEAITNGCTAPADACRSWQALCLGTRKLVDDLMEHVHLENNVLFPRFEMVACRVDAVAQE